MAKEIATSAFASSMMQGLKRVRISEYDVELIRNYAEKECALKLDDSFFDLGDLYETSYSLPGFENSPQGTEDEKTKYELIRELTGEITDIGIIEDYPKTFNKVKLFPLAIRNKSVNPDKNLAITLDVHNCETVIPDKDLIADELKDVLEGAVCELGLVKGLFELCDNGDISDRRDREKYIPGWTVPRRGLNGLYTPDPDEDDYEEEIENYIESPVDGNDRAYRIEIPSLRPGEKSWLGIIAVEDNGQPVEISYTIKSDNTDGSIEGILEESKNPGQYDA